MSASRLTGSRLLSSAALITISAGVTHAERVYIMNSMGYNMADAPLIAAIEDLGHTVDVSNLNATSLPPGFVSACEDPVNGYHWLCFYGGQSYIALIPQVQTFILSGGKVLLQYEVACCTIASMSAAQMASAFTGLSITPNAADYIAFVAFTNTPGWEAVSSTGCIELKGNAYKGMNGLPPANALNATANLNGSEPSITPCPNFGFVFQPWELPVQNGGLVGLGDINLYYENAGEPPNNGGIQPVDLNAVELIFGSPTNQCTLLPTGCLSTATAAQPPALFTGIFPNPADQQLFIQTSAGEPLDIQVINAVGQVLIRTSTGGLPTFQLSTRALAPGAYHLLLRQGEHMEAANFLIER